MVEQFSMGVGLIGMLLLFKIFWERMGSSSLTKSSFKNMIYTAIS